MMRQSYAGSVAYATKRMICNDFIRLRLIPDMRAATAEGSWDMLAFFLF